MRTMSKGFYLIILLATACMMQAGLAQELSSANEKGLYRYWVKFGDDGLIQRLGGHQALKQAAVSRSAEFTSEQQRMQQQQAAMLQTIAAEIGHDLQVSHHFLVTQNAVGALLTAEEAARIANVPGVVAVERERSYQLDTFRGPEFIGAASIWDGSATPDGSNLRGEGMVAAVLDTGVNTDHPSFANVAACGHGVGGTPDKLIAALDCATTDVDGRCNGPDPEDADGHGSHTASTVVGNTLDNTTVPPPNIPPPFTEMSGVAPCAHIRAYKVCPGDTCPGLNISAGMDTVILDGDVDTMNFSISGGTNPWNTNDGDRRKLDIVASGVFVAASAGNTRDTIPDPVGEVNHRGPWVMSVAASTRDGDFSANMSITGPGTPPSDTQGIAMNRGSDSPLGNALVSHPIKRDPNQVAGVEGCNAAEGGVAFPANFFTGAAALIQRGTCAFTDKINNAAAAGADLVVIWNNVAQPISMATPGQANIPAYSIELDPGQAVADFVDANPDSATMDFNIVPVPGDILAGFSFRGPTPAPLQDLQKPNITAPGVNIWAARANGEEFGFLSGTSMSGPHIAGAATLIRQAQPDWTPMEVKSAIQMTASKNGIKDDNITPWDWDDVGSGRVDLSKAALAGLVLDETFENFIAADPASGGDVKTLNLPAVRDVSCLAGCNWTRTLQSGQDFATTWNVTDTVITGVVSIDVIPSSFSLLPRSSDILFVDDAEDIDPSTPVSFKQPIEITVSGIGAGSGLTFGSVDFTEAGSLTPPAHITVAVGDQ
mgnify:CR=1 FL=1